MSTRRLSSRAALGAVLPTVLALSSLAPLSARAANPVLRHQADQRGDVVVFGSTLAFDCGAGVAAPPGAIASCAGQTNVADGAPDLYWLDDVANASVTPVQARTSATLSLPPGSTVTYARLYWAALKEGPDPDTDAVLDWLGGPAQTITADDSWVVSYGFASHPDWYYYQATGDATDFVSTWGAGDFRVSDVEGLLLANTEVDRAFSAWTLVVFYENQDDELRNLALFDAFEPIDPGMPGQGSSEVTLDGFLVPPGFAAKMATFGYEGDFAYQGDTFAVNGESITDGQNPIDNVYNSSRSEFGQPYSGTFDVPQLSGAAGTMAGYDLDTFDVTDQLSPGDTSAVVSAGSSYDIFFLGGFITSVTNLSPHFSVTKTYDDPNGGAIVTGDELEFTITGVNQGNDDAVDATIVDALPSGMVYLPGSLEIVSGGSNGNKTDAAGDDQAEHVGGTLTFRVGNGATSAVGGSVAPGASVSVRFRVSVTAASGTLLENQGFLSASGDAGSPEKLYPSDGDPTQVGEQPTVVPVDECQSDAQCENPKPHCNLVTHICEGCETDSDCPASAPACQPDGSCAECSASNTTLCPDDEPVCDLATGTCVLCTPESEEACAEAPEGPQCVSSDGGSTVHCGCETDADCGDATSGLVCDPQSDTCIEGCKGEGGNGCPDGAECTSTDTSIGQCVDGNAGGAGGGGPVPDNTAVQSGCACAVPGGEGGESDAARLLGALALGALAMVRRRRRG
jgi:uncharacterized repeat protein (TIGR01451 family)/MYXO-CTERM domain-containing protein